MFCTDRQLGSSEWITQIVEATFFRTSEEEGNEFEEILRLRLSNGQQVATLWLDGDAIADSLVPAVGNFEKASEIIGRRIATVIDSIGNIVQLQGQNRLLQRDGEGE